MAKKVKKLRKNLEIGEIGTIGVATPILGVSNAGLGTRRNDLPIIGFVFSYDRAHTSVRVIYKEGFALTDEAVMPLQIGNTVLVCHKLKSKENAFYLMKFLVNNNATGKLINKFEFTADNTSDVDNEFIEYAQYVIKKFNK